VRGVAAQASARGAGAVRVAAAPAAVAGTGAEEAVPSDRGGGRTGADLRARTASAGAGMQRGASAGHVGGGPTRQGGRWGVEQGVVSASGGHGQPVSTERLAPAVQAQSSRHGGTSQPSAILDRVTSSAETGDCCGGDQPRSATDQRIRQGEQGAAAGGPHVQGTRCQRTGRPPRLSLATIAGSRGSTAAQHQTQSESGSQHYQAEIDAATSAAVEALRRMRARAPRHRHAGRRRRPFHKLGGPFEDPDAQVRRAAYSTGSPLTPLHTTQIIVLAGDGKFPPGIRGAGHPVSAAPILRVRQCNWPWRTRLTRPRRPGAVHGRSPPVPHRRCV